MKRLFDILFSLLLLVVLFPLLVIISIIVTITSGFPLFFTQQRVGQNRELFRLIKFRSMLVKRGTEKGSFDVGNLSRVTYIGKILRKTKMDELPQLLNVLWGDMSLVGPRPEVEKWTKVYPERWDKVLSVKPGITDNASIEFRNEEELLAKAKDPEETYRNFILPIKLSLYEKYVDENSVKGDIVILYKTVKTVLFS